jgi:Ankyrin repeats (3 copies)/Domain of unknown function (DUF3471)
MRVIHVVTFLIALSFSSPVAFSQNAKQELNDQFWEAVRRGDAAAVTSLLDKGAEVNAKFRYGATALFKAAERGNVEIVKILLARGADVTVKDTFYGATAMTWALDNGHVEIVSALLEKQPASVNDILMSGVMRARAELVKLALAKGDLKKETLTTALVVARRNKEKPEIAELLKNAGAVPPPQVNPATLQTYAGKYKSDAGMEVTVAVSEGNLTAVAAGQRPQQLVPLDDTTFRALFVENILLRFKVEDGKVTGLTLNQGQVTTQLVRVVETKQP